MEPLTSNVRSLPGTVNRVETHVSHRKQKAGHLCTRHSSHHNSRLISQLIAHAHASVSQNPTHNCPSAAARRTLAGRSFSSVINHCHGARYFSRRPTRAKYESRFTTDGRPFASARLIGTPVRLETGVSRRKQRLGCRPNRYGSRVTLCVEFWRGSPVRELSLVEN
jgi:hypothetical protein